MAGLKYDHAKNRVDLIPTSLIHWVGAVLTYGAEKYAAWSWSELPEMEDRYYAAALRHLLAYRDAQRFNAPELETDEESGLPHLAHAATCIAFLLDAAHGIEDPNIAEIIARGRAAKQKEDERRASNTQSN